MSARVFNPLVMSEMRRMMSRSGSDASGTPATVARVRRDLFGPVDHEEVQSFVDKEMAAMRKRESDKWGFDFERETPLDNSRFRWERVTPENNIPQAYALRRLALRLEPRNETTAETSTTSNTKASESANTTTTHKPKSAPKQSQMTDFLKSCRKRSLSAGAAAAKLGAPQGAGDGTETGPAGAKRKRSHPQMQTRQ